MRSGHIRTHRNNKLGENNYVQQKKMRGRTAGKTETSVSQRLTKVSPKLTKNNIFVGFWLISIGLWPTEV
jgi:hypothetical protein